MVALVTALLARVVSAGGCQPEWDNSIGQPGMCCGPVNALAVFDDGLECGPSLFAAGQFIMAGEETALRVAKWDGAQWFPVGEGMNDSVEALTVFDDGSGGGPALYAGGHFTVAGKVAAARIARWDGEQWSALGNGINGHVNAMAVFDDGDGPALYAGLSGSPWDVPDADGIAKWDGEQWSAVGSGMNNQVFALAVFDDGLGSGPALYAGGDFTMAGGETALSIARWDGSQWSVLGKGLNNSVHALTVFDDGVGGGPALYVGGEFTFPSRVARWDGEQWTGLGDGVDGEVNALAVFDDGTGSGPALYAGGNFSFAGRVQAHKVAKWNGRLWSALGGWTNGSGFHVLTAFDDGSESGPALFAGGDFDTAGDLPANHITAWQGCGASPLGDLDGNGVVDGIDLGILLANWSIPPGVPCGTIGGCIADLNGDGFINGIDLGILLANWTF